ncbi:MAG: hypothetical protein E5V35_28065, partial [Mesorhizobium sp.]
MALTKKDQERVIYAWMYGAQALKDGKERMGPRTGRGVARAKDCGAGKALVARMLGNVLLDRSSEVFSAQFDVYFKA